MQRRGSMLKRRGWKNTFPLNLVLLFLSELGNVAFTVKYFLCSMFIIGWHTQWRFLCVKPDDRLKSPQVILGPRSRRPHSCHQLSPFSTRMDCLFVYLPTCFKLLLCLSLFRNSYQLPPLNPFVGKCKFSVASKDIAESVQPGMPGHSFISSNCQGHLLTEGPRALPRHGEKCQCVPTTKQMSPPCFDRSLFLASTV